MTNSNATGSEPLARWLDLMRAAFDTQVRLGKEYAEVTKAAFNRNVDQGALGRTYLKSAQREAERYWRSVGTLWLNYASDLLAAGSRASSAVLHDVGGVVGQQRHRPADAEPAAPTSDSRHLELLLSGPLGGTATGTVTVANNHPDARRLVLKPGPLLGADGEPVAVTINVKPKTIQLEPGAERAVTVTVEIDKAELSAGETYESVIDVSGGDDAQIRLTVRPQPAAK